jgi:hypothetical protein
LSVEDYLDEGSGCMVPGMAQERETACQFVHKL